jgi:hypothetical protein
MARKSSHKPNLSSTPKSISGAVGGPSTGRGLNYQVNYSIFRTIDFISRALCAPHKVWMIRIEPRAPSQGKLTRWDISTEPPEKYFEAKLNPKRQEILEWLEHIQTAGKTYPQREFRLVYSEGGGSLLIGLGHLLRIAQETGNQKEFDNFIEEENKDSQEILSRLGSENHSLLRRIKLKNIPENVLENNISLRARWLSGDMGGKRLLEILSLKFHNAIPNRSSFLISDIIKEILDEGIQLQVPPDITPHDLPQLVASTIVILQACRSRVPIDVIASALGHSAEDVLAEVSKYIGNVLRIEDRFLSIGPLPSRITIPNGLDIIAHTLDTLLVYINHHKNEPVAVEQINNVLDLTNKCALSHPQSVAYVFPALDKLLKRLGNKQLVLL